MNPNELILVNNAQKVSTADMMLVIGDRIRNKENYDNLWQRVRYIRQLQKLFDSSISGSNLSAITGCVNYINYLLGEYKRSGTVIEGEFILLNGVNNDGPFPVPQFRFIYLYDVLADSYTGLKGYTWVVNAEETGLIPKKFPENPSGGQPILVWNQEDADAGDYDKDTFVSHEGKIWKSLVDNNTVEPSLSATAFWEAQSVEDFTESVLTEDIPVSNPDLGLDLPYTFPIGMGFTSFVKKLVQKTQFPNLIAPTFGMSNNAGTREPGETFSITVTFNFNRGNIQGANVGGVWNPSASQGQRAGAATEYIIDGTSTGATNSRTYSKTAVLGTNTINGTVSYGVGQQPYNSDGGIKDANGIDMIPFPAGTSPAQSTTFQSILKSFFGPTASVPVNSASVRALPSNNFSNTNVFILNTGTVQTIFAFAVPQGKNIVSVIDLDALNANITSSYIVTVFDVADAGGTERPYKVAVMQIAIPYDSNHRHQITLS